MTISPIRTPNLEPAKPYIRTLGDVGIFASRNTLDSKPLFGPGKPLAIAAYLAHLPERTATREQLIDLIWSDMPVDAARHSLRSTVWAMRKKTGDSLITADKYSVALGDGVRSDREDFIEAVEHTNFEKAVSLYGSHFLEGVGSLGGADFDHWVDGERYRLSLLLRRAAEVAIQARLVEGSTRHAVEIAESVRKLDPGNQALVRLVIETKLADGAVVAARVESEALTEFLRHNDRVTEPATHRILKIASHLREPPPRPEVEGGNLIGRTTKIRLLTEKWAAIETTGHEVVVISGRSGIGKTRLLDVFHNTLSARGSNSAFLRAPVGQSEVPYGAISDLVGQLGSRPGALAVSPAAAGILLGINPTLSARFHGGADHAPADERLGRRISAVVELILAVAHEAPLALLIDNFDRWDATSRQVFIEILPRLNNQPVKVFLSCRDSDRISETQSTIPLNPLSEDQVGELMGYSEPFPVIHQISVVTEGVPQSIHSLIQQLHSEGLLKQEGEVWTWTDAEKLIERISVPTHLEPDPVAPSSIKIPPLIWLVAGITLGFLLALLITG
jgi:DNA-binding SARP family transcriptional activator